MMYFISNKSLINESGVDSDKQLVLGVVGKSVQSLVVEVLKQRLLSSSEIQLCLDICQGQSRVLNVLLGDETSSLVQNLSGKGCSV